MKILAIETSCDETALAYIEAQGGLEKPQFTVVQTALYSQIEKHREFGGVFPALAKREHAKNLVPLLGQLFSGLPESTLECDETEIAKILEREPGLAEELISFVTTHQKPDVDLITVTSGPGLEPALWVGINFAKALSLTWNIPILPVNHMEGHIVSVLTESPNITFPALALLISGGHTELVLVKNWGEYEIIGQTKDDAVGEAYDKVARMLDLPYPGGPEISKHAQNFREKNQESDYSLPRPMMHTKDYDFSFSGLKTAVLYETQKCSDITDDIREHISGEFEQAVVDVILKKTERALEEFSVHSLIVGGGVIANKYIRENLSTLCDKIGIPVFFPTHELSTDNAVMIGVAGYLKAQIVSPEINPNIIAEGNLKL